MDEFESTKNELLNAVKKPERKRKPSNAGLWLALAFFNLVLLTIDIISGVTVYRLTGIWFYGLLTILAGAVPLLIAEVLYTRPFASKTQRNLSIGMAVLAFASILTIGIFAAIGNVKGVTIAASDMELAMIITIVSLALSHGLMCAFYFYSDEGIVADQTLVREIADSLRTTERLTIADQILKITDKAVARRKAIGGKYNGGKEALLEVLKRLGEDLDSDGIPDVLEGHGQINRQQPRQPQMNAVPAYGKDVADESARPLPDQKRQNGERH